jgi:hypothetical protein
MAEYEPAEKSAAYWQRELTPNGQKINDALDKHERVTAERKLTGEAADNSFWAWEIHQSDKQEWREGLQQTGELVTPRQRDEREFQQRAPDYRSAPSEAYADVAGDPTLSGRLGREAPAQILADIRQEARERAEPAAAFWSTTMQAGRDAAPKRQEVAQKAMQP